jgi:hypothetical protein
MNEILMKILNILPEFVEEKTEILIVISVFNYVIKKSWNYTNVSYHHRYRYVSFMAMLE